MKISKLGMVAVTASLLAVTFTTLASEANGFAQRHPRRAAVLRNDQGINRQLMNDRGRLGGNFGSLEKQNTSNLANKNKRTLSINGKSYHLGSTPAAYR